MARILVVDDQPEIRQLVHAILQADGHNVTMAEDGQSALDILSNSSPDLVVLDVMMPYLDGYGVLKALRSKGSLGSTKFLMLTAKTNEADWLKGYQSGAHRYLTKPFDPEDLSQAVQDLLSMSKEQL